MCGSGEKKNNTKINTYGAAVKADVSCSLTYQSSLQLRWIMRPIGLCNRSPAVHGCCDNALSPNIYYYIFAELRFLRVTQVIIMSNSCGSNISAAHKPSDRMGERRGNFEIRSSHLLFWSGFNYVSFSSKNDLLPCSTD